MQETCGVKICGTTTIHDAKMAAEYGSDYFGVVVEVDFSPRSLTIEDSRPLFDNPPIDAVALVFNMEVERLHHLIKTLKPFAVQFLHLEKVSLIRELKEHYPNVQLWQSIHLPEAGKDVDFNAFKDSVQKYVDAGIDLLIFDTVAVMKGVTKFGGTGLISDWDVVKVLMDQIETSVPVWLAGGINPDNVRKAIQTVHPKGVDLCSGVEAKPGEKDPDKVRRLVEQAKNNNLE